MKPIVAITAALLGLMPWAAAALSLSLPQGAEQTMRRTSPMDSYRVPVAALRDGELPAITAEGHVTAEAWRISGTALSTLQVLDMLREQLRRQGYQILLTCETEACGGFDFRYRLDLFPEPEMHVDLGDFRYLSGRRDGPDGRSSFVSLMVSRGGQSVFIQMNRIEPAPPDAAEIVTSTMSAAPEAVAAAGDGALSLGERLAETGRVTLDDLKFGVGSAELEGAGFASLAELAAWLRANPDKTIALVGHTDAQGSLEANMALSRRRAAEVKHRLEEQFGIEPARIEAQGVGYLVPRASNLTEEGRERNRRVEAVLTSTR